MILHKEAEFSKNKDQQQCCSIDTRRFVRSGDEDVLSQFPRRVDAKSLLSPPVIEWTQPDLVKMESFLKYQYFPIILKLKITLGACRNIYFVPFKFFAHDLIPGISQQQLIFARGLDYVLENNIEEYQIVKVGEGYECCLYFVSEEFYLKALRRITN